ncbi:hypothetical protein B1756_17005 [Natrarchaeobaculum aegyptiacum]|uniref:Sm domain-containing protein n=2 Tax=Natrarchaeobaculum aegyptiacum TaxID=745377 RepID=A0A2Z2HY57_9EURY|nr:hypothetical protein B1756_17005 [Natrarchaeobaculum aegyptiacum]
MLGEEVTVYRKESKPISGRLSSYDHHMNIELDSMVVRGKEILSIGKRRMDDEASAGKSSTTPKINLSEKEQPSDSGKSQEKSEKESRSETTSTYLSELRDQAIEESVDEISVQTTQRTTQEYTRSSAVREYVKARANGNCEGCGNPAPFTSKTGEPYLHAHHIHELSDKGSDKPDTVVALCPNCHFRVHHGEDGEEYNESLFKYAKELEDSQQLETISEEDNDSNELEYNYPLEKFAQVEIEKVNGKGNLLTFSENIPKDHLHISHGQKGEKVIVFLGSDSSMYSNQLQYPNVPFDSVEDAARNYSPETDLILKENDLIKIPDPVIVPKERPVIHLNGYNIERIELDGDVKKGYQLTVRITNIDGEVAKGTVEATKRKNSGRKKSRRKKKRKKKRNKRSTGTRNPFNGFFGSKNENIKNYR